MSISYNANHGVGSEEVSDTVLGPITIANASVPVGALFCVAVAMDEGTHGGVGVNTDTTRLTVTDSQGHTYARVKERRYAASATANSGVNAGLFYTVITTQLDISVDTVTVTNGAESVAAKILGMLSFINTSGAWQLDDSAVAASFGSTPNVALSGLSSVERVLIAMVGWEYSSTGLTQDADYTGVNNANSGTQSSGGMTLWTAYRIATLTDDSYDSTKTVGTDWVAILAGFSEVISAGVDYELAPVVAEINLKNFPIIYTMSPVVAELEVGRSLAISYAMIPIVAEIQPLMLGLDYVLVPVVAEISLLSIGSTLAYMLDPVVATIQLRGLGIGYVLNPISIGFDIQLLDSVVGHTILQEGSVSRVYASGRARSITAHGRNRTLQ